MILIKCAVPAVALAAGLFYIIVREMRVKECRSCGGPKVAGEMYCASCRPSATVLRLENVK